VSRISGVSAVIETAELESTAPRRPGLRAAVAALGTVAAATLVLLALAVQAGDPTKLTPLGLVLIPVEALLGGALLLVLRRRAHTVVAVTLGVLLGLLTVLRVLQIGFLNVLGRPFDPVFDWFQLGAGVTLLEGSMGRAGALGVAGAAAVLAIALVVLTGLAVRRTACVAIRHPPAAARTIGLLAVVWVLCFALGAQLAPAGPIAATSSLAVYETAQQVSTSVRDQRVFDEQAAVDAFDGVADGDLLAALRGKDVIFTYVESYGRSAVEDPEFAPTVEKVLDDGAGRLADDGFGFRTAFLTSSVTGGGSWLAHATLLSGLRVTNQHSYEKLVASDRVTVTSAFRRAGWQTVAVMPSTGGHWPAGTFFGFDRVYDATNLGNKSTIFNGFQTPDQYTLSAFERAERGRPDRGPLMAEIPLVTSHWPWAEVPRLRDWDDVGDGSVFDGPAAGQSVPEHEVTGDPARMRDGYRQSLAYSLSTVMSYVDTYGDENLVFVLLGDHQPPAFITGENAGRDVPITIMTRDRALLDRIGAWGWQDGVRPSPTAPVWPMESFRDRFLTAFGA
jgi:hypothetical protein